MPLKKWNYDLDNISATEDLIPFWSSNPSKPLEWESIMWMSDWTWLWGDGDIMVASTVSWTTRYQTLFNHSAGSVW